MAGFLDRIGIIIVGIFFPPLAVALISGASMDLVMNCCLLFLAVFPAHIHGFYCSGIYFHRRKKVQKGLYPGGPKTFIYSDQILNGGYSNAVVEQLRQRTKPRS